MGDSTFFSSSPSLSLSHILCIDSMYKPFRDEGLTCEELTKPWTPHCTIMKLSKQNNRHSKKQNYINTNDNKSDNNNNNNNNNSNDMKPVFGKVNKIDKAAYEKHLAIKFGEQIFAGVELSSMGGVDPDGYYPCIHKEIFYFEPNQTSPTTTTTVSIPLSPPPPSPSPSTTTTSTS